MWVDLGHRHDDDIDRELDRESANVDDRRGRHVLDRGPRGECHLRRGRGRELVLHRVRQELGPDEVFTRRVSVI
jgi:hypothetical protein